MIHRSRNLITGREVRLTLSTIDLVSVVFPVIFPKSDKPLILYYIFCGVLKTF